MILALRLTLLFALAFFGSQAWSYTGYSIFTYDVIECSDIEQNVEPDNQKSNYDDRLNVRSHSTEGLFSSQENNAHVGCFSALLVDFLATKNTVGGLRAAGKKDAHHIIQDAAAKNLPNQGVNQGVSQ